VLNAQVQSFSRAARTLTVKDAVGSVYQFALRDDTTIATGQRLDEFLDGHPVTSPWAVSQSVIVTWKPSTDGKKRIATAVR
jgi:hypothetical protein